jgi:hypothetical protein
MMHAGIRLARGVPVFPDRWQVMRRARVLYVDGEESFEKAQARTQCFDEPAWFHVLNCNYEMKQGRPNLFSLYEPEKRAILDRYIEAYKIEVVILDNIFCLFGVMTENEVEKWTAVEQWVARHKGAGRSIIFIHHEPKSRPGQAYGTVMREALCEVDLKLVPVNDRDESDDESDQTQETLRRVEFGKGRYLSGSDKVGFMVGVRLDETTGKYVVRAIDTEPRKPGRPKTDEAEEKRRKISELAAQGKSSREIAGIVGVSEQYVRRVLKAAEASSAEGETETAKP